MANSTTPDTVGWVPEPATRGTAGLLFGCLSTILICTWSSFHSNVTDTRYSTNRRLLARLENWAFSLLAPEVVAVVAITEFLVARRLRKRMEDKQRSIEWPMSLSFFVHMGGVHVHDSQRRKIILPADFVDEFFVNNWIDPLEITPMIVEDKNKANGFTKLFACFQISWLLSQIIGRRATHLPITTLEYLTLAYILCALISYVCWWDKPFDVGMPLVLKASPTFSEEDRQRIIKESDWEVEEARIPFNKIHVDSWGVGAAIISCCVVFSLPHFLAWNAGFSSTPELWMWRVACVLSAATPPWFFASTFLPDTSFFDLIFYFIGSVYIIARLYLFVESFASLRAVPPQVYSAVPFSQYIPHF